MYTPDHLAWLDGTKKDAQGWPVFVTEEGKEYCRRMLKRGFARFRTMDLELAYQCIFRDYVRENGEVRPECLTLGLWDAVYGVTHRALLDIGAHPGRWFLDKQ